MDAASFLIIAASISLLVASANYVASAFESITLHKRLLNFFVYIAAAGTWYLSWQNLLVSEQKAWTQAEVQFRSDWLQQKQLNERLNYERALRGKTEEIAALNREIVSGITGGDSFIYVASTVGPNSNEAMLTLAHRGKYPVFDVSIELRDMAEMDARQRAMGLKDYSGPISRQQLLELAKPKASFNFQTVRPNVAVRLRDERQLPTDKNSVHYSLSIIARNGVFSQSLLLNRVRGSWSQASQVFKSDGSKRKLLYQWVDPDFPRDKQGKVVWKGDEG